MRSYSLNIIHPIVLIRVNQRYKDYLNEQQLYEATRGIWKVNLKRAKNAKYAFSVYKGDVKEIYEIEYWQPAQRDGYPTREDVKVRADVPFRKEFVGKVAPEDIRKLYRYKSVSDRFELGNQNPINYVNC
jgi:uncharacterized protein